MFGGRLGVDDVYLFVSPRGTVANDSPHAMRHAGMTNWFAQGIDQKRIQGWGGWTMVGHR